MLHIVTRLNALDDLARYLFDTDNVLLTEEAVYAVNPQHKKHALLPVTVTVSALLPDLQARGVESVCAPHITLVDFAGFVDLTAESDKSMTW
ncbi:sulfurtransferase complex subunit TusB [Vibrio rarus]|uniref:sulfurtransferase complex subunit TusB n=1 Tax=Vibrio rarus TaxID=413403 RepID=UPI0021C3DDC5|nr:sulfurtransferase complex subunit TusB [Vibrio rarus]